MDEGKIGRKEELNIETRLATSKDWQIYKDFTMQVLTGPDARMFRVGGPEYVEIQSAKTAEDWQKDLESEAKFVVLAYNNGDPVGMGSARKNNGIPGVWHIGFAYTKNEFRKRGVGRKIISERLKEMRNRGAKSVRVWIEADNTDSISNCESFGFERRDPSIIKYDNLDIQKKVIELGLLVLELDLTKEKSGEPVKLKN